MKKERKVQSEDSNREKDMKRKRKASLMRDERKVLGKDSREEDLDWQWKEGEKKYVKREGEKIRSNSWTHDRKSKRKKKNR